MIFVSFFIASVPNGWQISEFIAHMKKFHSIIDSRDVTQPIISMSPIISMEKHLPKKQLFWN